MRKKKVYVNAYNSVKSHQHLVNKLNEKVMDWEVDYFVVNDRRGVISKRVRSKIGHVEKKNK